MLARVVLSSMARTTGASFAVWGGGGGIGAPDGPHGRGDTF
jgi:hypothetical protein